MAADSERAGGESEPAGKASPLAWTLLVPVHAYRKLVSPLLPPMCRFYPSCSAYAVEALKEHGAFRGSWLAARRLLRCGPWHPGGLDPVPPRRAADQGEAPPRSVEQDTRIRHHC